MDSQREARKRAHIVEAIGQKKDTRPSGWEDIHLVHQALGQGVLNNTDCSTIIWGKRLAMPLVINAMTGGAPGLLEINAALARTAASHGIGLAVGSQTAGIDNPLVRDTYEIVRAVNPEGLIFANISALVDWESARQAVAMIGADALQLHLNIAQELLMAEGDRDFSKMLLRISQIVDKADVPVMVKEVGFGLSRETVLRLVEAGVVAVDTAGTGGTNFARIERTRHPEQGLGFLDDWGLPAAVSLLEVKSVQAPLTVMASGGILGGMDIIKALALGADLAGMAGLFLKTFLHQGEEALNLEIQAIFREVKALMLLTGAKDIRAVKSNPVVVMGRVKEWCDQRGIDTARLARR